MWALNLTFALMEEDINIYFHICLNQDLNTLRCSELPTYLQIHVHVCDFGLFFLYDASRS